MGFSVKLWPLILSNITNLMPQTLSADVLPKLINTVENFTIVLVNTVIILLIKTNGLVYNPASETTSLTNLTLPPPYSLSNLVYLFFSFQKKENKRRVCT